MEMNMGDRDKQTGRQGDMDTAHGHGQLRNVSGATCQNRKQATSTSIVGVAIGARAVQWTTAAAAAAEAPPTTNGGKKK